MTPTEIRLKLLAQGYQPIPTAGKVPLLSNWTKREPTSAGDIEVWSKLYEDTNTGILCATVPCLDIDIEDPDAADAVEAIVRERFEERGAICVRFGRTPRRAIFFKAATPFKHAERKFVAPNGDTKQKIEMLADGRQVIVHGIHDGTGKPYSWFGPALCDTPRDDLPAIDQAGTEALLDEIARVLVEAHGYQLAPSRRPGNGTDTEASSTDWDVLQRDILAGHSLHEGLRDLSCKMIYAGMEPGAVVNFLRGLMEQSATPRDERWQERVSAIPRLVEGAVKLRAQASKPMRRSGAQSPAESGAALLNDVRGFLCRFVSYPSVHAAIAHTLWVVHTHLMSAWESTARLSFLSPEPGSGKTRALEVTETLVPRPVHATNVSPAYLYRKCGGDEGPPTILFDEIDAIFGPKAREHEDVRSFLNSGHRRGATFGRCVVYGRRVETEDVQSFAAVALAGLGWLPDSIMTRSVIIRMRRRAPDERVEAFRHRTHAPMGKELFGRLEAWAAAVAGQAEAARPEMPAGIEDRTADVWEPLLAVADLAGGEWPALARNTAVALVAAATTDTPPSMNIRLLSDLRTVFMAANAAVQATTPKGLPTKVILEALNALEDAPWRHLKEPLNDHSLASLLLGFGIKSQKLRPPGSNQCKGYRLTDLSDAWRRYLPSPDTPSPGESVTSVTTVTSEEIQGDARDAAAPLNVPGHDRASHAGSDTPDVVTDMTDMTPFPEGAETPALPAAGDKGLSAHLIGELADWYLGKSEEERVATGTVQQSALDALLRAALAERGVFPEFIEVEFERVMEVVFAPLGQRTGR
ncbi:DUF3631 domain-containing protein [Bradyrhizobium japonicum]|uniref:DUF3631 domain-containing protein n=1 Tax=Bradyrhizobium japonicum TaxID=375 RepID=UPI001BA58789|nr:DUF3631 domain-containing protein [Bradyrhizobium japonicum]MBR0733491.1 DUF3631 domain-containing protein [Bradyrhizobium japonicum]